ncbi:MAG TPA: cation diffusion facilitator family transporter [Candidatus Binatia bacterium]
MKAAPAPPGESKTAVIAAIAGNVAIAIAKFIAAAFTGSSAMLSEAIHSLVDTGNGGLILLGIHRSRLPPDAAHPFGYGHELYFWTLVVGIFIFAIGGGMSIFEGISHVLSGQAAEASAWNYAVLGIAALFEGTSWVFGWRAFRREQRGRGVFETVHLSKDPTSFSVLFEDSAALAGLAVAFLGVYLSHRLDMPALDGAASIVIGAILSLVAIVMMRESKGLLVGEGVERPTLEAIRAILARERCVQSVGRLLTLYLGPEEVLLTIEIQFDTRMSTLEIRDAIRRIKDAIQSKYARITRIYFDALAMEETDDKNSV